MKKNEESKIKKRSGKYGFSSRPVINIRERENYSEGA